MKVIKFDKDAIDIDGVIRLGFTNRAFQELSRIYSEPEPYIAVLSGLRRIILTPAKDRDMFTLHTTFGNFFCGVNLKFGEGFSILSFKENSLESQNQALKYGIICSVNGGLDIGVLLPDMDMCFRYLSGGKYDFNDLETENTSSSVEQILSAVRADAEKKRILDLSGREKEEEELPPKDDYANQYLKEVLKEAEQFSILSSELEEKKTKEQGKLSYGEFYPSDYERTDRTAYVFAVEELDKNVFKTGVQVEITGSDDERLGGEIVEIDSSDKKHIKVTVLFNHQVSLEALPAFGWMSLSFSTVNKDVQLEANEKILNGTAKAKYLKNVLGANEPAGFDRKDLTQVQKALAKEKYPPNPSQMGAIERGINTKDIFLVMGPPGTGKTTVILHWVKYFVNVEHKRVLISSQNNKAVDNVLERLAQEKDIDVIRIGSEAKLQSGVLPYMFENKLKTLNERIDQATAEAVAKLEKAVREWRIYRDGFFALSRQLREIEDLKEQLKKDLEEGLLPLARKRKACLERYEELRQEKRTIRRKLQKCEEQIREYEKKNLLTKMLLKSRQDEESAVREECRRLLIEQEGKLQEEAGKYEKYSVQYRIQKQTLKDSFVFRMKKAVRAQKKAAEGLSNPRPAEPGAGSCFRGLWLFPDTLESAGKLEIFLQQIQAEIDRAEKILSAERLWRGSIVGRQNYALNEVVLESVDLVGATCIGINSQRRFSNLHFDVTIIDEAGQIQIHNALVPMSVSNKLIMLGDYKQIPPSADQDLIELCGMNGVSPELLKKSLFEKLYEDLPDANKAMLDTQFRMPGEIADIISEWFYEGKYKSADVKRNLKGLLPWISEKPFLIVDTSRTSGREETRTESRGTYNELEARICRELLNSIAEKENHAALEQIGIISAYKDQVKRIKKEIKEITGPERANEMAATLDSFQGQERDLILYSFTKSSGKKASMNRIGFLNELRRLNVAMSRCKKMLIMIGDMTFLSGCMHQNVDENGKEIYAQSEKEFSDFICKMMKDVQNGRGEMISYEELKGRLG